MSISYRGMLVLEVQPTAAGNGNTDTAVARTARIYEVTCVCTATDSGAAATAQLLRQALGAGAFNAITNAMACTTSGAVARTTTITAAEQLLTATDVLRLALASGTGGGGGGTQNGRVYLRVCPSAIE